MTTSSPSGIIAPGTVAPDFTLAAGPDSTISLSDYRGQAVVLVFYPADWSPTCGDQVGVYSEMVTVFETFNAKVLGISVDGTWCHKAFVEARRILFPLLADFEPKGDVARQYGVYRPQNGISERAIIIVDAAGIVRWSYLSPIGVNPGADGIVKALEALTPEQRGTAG